MILFYNKINTNLNKIGCLICYASLTFDNLYNLAWRCTLNKPMKPLQSKFLLSGSGTTSKEKSSKWN